MTTPDETTPAGSSSRPVDDNYESVVTRPALLDLPAQWSKLTSDQKLRAKQLGVVSTIALLGLGLYTASTSGNKEAPQAPQASNLDMGAGLRGDSLELKRSEEHTSELQSLMRISYAVFCLKKKKKQTQTTHKELK